MFVPLLLTWLRHVYWSKTDIILKEIFKLKDQIMVIFYMHWWFPQSLIRRDNLNSHRQNPFPVGNFQHFVLAIVLSLCEVHENLCLWHFTFFVWDDLIIPNEDVKDDTGESYPENQVVAEQIQALKTKALWEPSKQVFWLPR